MGGSTKCSDEEAPSDSKSDVNLLVKIQFYHDTIIEPNL